MQIQLLSEVSYEQILDYFVRLSKLERHYTLDKVPECVLSLDFWKNWKPVEDSLWFGIRDCPEKIAGVFGLSKIQGYPYFSCYIDGEFSPEYYRKGYARPTYNHIVNYGFTVLGLHKIYTAFDPANKIMFNLVKKCGGKLEGISKDYILINGEWKDYMIASKINKEND